MKPLVILFATLIMVSPIAWSVPANNLMGELPDTQSVPIPIIHEASTTEQTNHSICVMVAGNSIQAKRNKNKGFPLEESIRQLDLAIASAKERHGLDLSEPSTVANDLSYRMLRAIHQVEMKATTEQELLELGEIIYDNCYHELMEQFIWEYEE